MTQRVTLLSPARVTAPLIRNDAFRAALERHPELRAALLGRSNAPALDLDADNSWHRRGETET